MNGRRGGSESRRHPRSSAVSPPSKQKNSGASGKPRVSLLGGHRTRGGDDASAFTPRPSAPIESAIADPYLPEIPSLTRLGPQRLDLLIADRPRPPSLTPVLADGGCFGRALRPAHRSCCFRSVHGHSPPHGLSMVASARWIIASLWIVAAGRTAISGRCHVSVDSSQLGRFHRLPSSHRFDPAGCGNADVTGCLELGPIPRSPCCLPRLLFGSLSCRHIDIVPNVRFGVNRNRHTGDEFISLINTYTYRQVAA